MSRDRRVIEAMSSPSGEFSSRTRSAVTHMERTLRHDYHRRASVHAGRDGCLAARARGDLDRRRSRREPDGLPPSAQSAGAPFGHRELHTLRPFASQWREPASSIRSRTELKRQELLDSPLYHIVNAENDNLVLRTEPSFQRGLTSLWFQTGRWWKWSSVARIAGGTFGCTAWSRRMGFERAGLPKLD